MEVTLLGLFPEFPGKRDNGLCEVDRPAPRRVSSYRRPEDAMRFPKETRIDCIAHFDNSSFNPFNPDPQATVRHGLQTSDEMMFGFLFFTRDDEALNLNIEPKTGHVTEN
ncbi:MAG: hypothetical protein WKF77_22285 [Planctomycetaceae bacterium]